MFVLLVTSGCRCCGKAKEIASDALRKIRVSYEVLPVITDPREALKPEAFRIHPERENNIISHNKIRKGDVAKDLRLLM